VENGLFQGRATDSVYIRLPSPLHHFTKSCTECIWSLASSGGLRLKIKEASDSFHISFSIVREKSAKGR